MAARLEGPIWEVRKLPRSALGLPGPEIVKINKNFIKNTTEDLPPARIWESGLPGWSPEKATRYRFLLHVCGETADSCFQRVLCVRVSTAMRVRHILRFSYVPMCR